MYPDGDSQHPLTGIAEVLLSKCFEPQCRMVAEAVGIHGVSRMMRCDILLTA